ncbi:hypothetical protein DIPPA_16643 [Diplonema papillatum]|nr:hypothetical protein DIPPA_16643 [Diplonema papillatum]
MAAGARHRAGKLEDARGMKHAADRLRVTAENKQAAAVRVMADYIRLELDAEAPLDADDIAARARKELDEGLEKEAAAERLDRIWAAQVDPADAVLGNTMLERLEAVATRKAERKEERDEELFATVKEQLKTAGVAVPASMSWTQLAGVAGKSKQIRETIERVRAERRLMDSIPPAFRNAGVGPGVYAVVEGLAAALRFASQMLREVAGLSTGSPDRETS